MTNFPSHVPGSKVRIKIHIGEHVHGDFMGFFFFIGWHQFSHFEWFNIGYPKNQPILNSGAHHPVISHPYVLYDDPNIAGEITILLAG